jgi:hypothetical protein
LFATLTPISYPPLSHQAFMGIQFGGDISW